jgi:pSer/pThr/pTyr-binding forkhead associated (FHA) protein
MIEDLNSTNGVFLGEKQVKKYRLRDGDVVSLGVHELVYHDLRQLEEPVDDQLEDTIEDQLDDDDDQDSAVNET